MNTHLHILEAYTSLYRIWPDEQLAAQIRSLITLFTDRIIDRGTGHLRLFFDEHWQVRSDIISYGHDIEASWLLQEAVEAIEPAHSPFVQRIQELSVKVASASAGGLNADGSMNYEYEPSHDRLTAERHWWVQAEAMVGFLNAWRLTTKDYFFNQFTAIWDFIGRYIVDHRKGEWFWGLKADGSVMTEEDKVGFWKCPYHNSRACIEVIRRLSPVLLILLTFFFLPSQSYSQGFLKADGRIIVNDKGEKVILRGMGMGGWMLQEGYMFRLGNIGRQYKIKAAISDLVGPEKTKLFYDRWLSQHTRKIDIDSMAAWGFNSVRLPMHYNLFTLPVGEEPVAGSNTWLEKGFAMTDSLLNWCKAAHMYLILDLHATPGGQGNDLPISDRDPAKPSLWESDANRQKMIALWQKLATRYANEPWIGGYDIINEPNWGFEDSTDKRGTREKKNEPLKQLMMDVTKAIRQVDTNHIIIIEGNGFGNNYSGILPAWDKNMVMSFHKYGNYNSRESIHYFLDLREKYGLPLWLGETGENSNTWFTEEIRLVEGNDIGWAMWQLKKMGLNNPLEIPVAPGWQRLVDYWTGKGPRPSADEAWHTLQELLENIRLENNVYHPDVTDAMFRQVYSKEALPFKRHRIVPDALIDAVDYDLGSQRIAYFDKDTARYQYVSPPPNTTGNRGREYRNDGVDIQADTVSGQRSFYVFSIEDGEWLQYTTEVEKAGHYSIVCRIASAFQLTSSSSQSVGQPASPLSGRLSFSDNGAILARQFQVPDTGGPQSWQDLTIGTVHLSKGRHVFRLYADQGGFNVKSIQFRTPAK
jgi:hypothetical protein